MRFLAFLNSTAGVRGFVVTSADGEVLAESNPSLQQTWTPARLLSVAQDFEVVGELGGLGNFSGVSIKTAKSSRLLARRQDGLALLDIEPGQNTLELEEKLRTTEWTSKTEIPLAEDDIEPPEEPETVRPPAVPPRPAPPRTVSTSTLQAAAAKEPPSRRVPGAPMPTSTAESRSVPRPTLEAAPQTRKPPLGSLLTRPTRSGANAATAPLAAPLASADLGSEVRPVSRNLLSQSSDQLPVASPPASATSPSFTGSLQLFSLPDLLEFLRVGQRTGTLVCASSRGVGTIQLRRGRITAAAAVGVLTLGELLAQRTILSRPQLEEAQRLQTQNHANTPLASLLLMQKWVARDALYEALMSHVVLVLRQLMTWEAGEFSFDPTVRPELPDAEVGIDLDPQGVLLNIFKELDDAQRA